jgi:hypothetical protein
VSRTQKDKPFWVRLNQEGKYTEHDHRDIGKSYTRKEYVYDENGEKLYEEVPFGYTAEKLLTLVRTHLNEETGQFEYYMGWDPRTMKNIPYGTYRRAKELLSAGRGDEFIQLATARKPVLREVVKHHADHCTEGEPITGRTWRLMPCTPSLGHEGYYWRYGDSKARGGLLRTLHGKDRAHTNSTLRTMAKAANFRDEGWEDDYEYGIQESTKPYKNGMAWLLW